MVERNGRYAVIAEKLEILSTQYDSFKPIFKQNLNAKLLP